MGRRPRCSEDGLNIRRAWTAMEDKILTEHIKIHGEGQWKYLPEKTGLKRCGKSCRLRWLNYLKPGIKRGNISQEEEEIIIRLHQNLGNRWSLIAERLHGRTDNEIKNYWYTKIRKKIKDDRKKIKDDHGDGDGDDSTTSSDPTPLNDHNYESLEGLNLTDEKQQGLCEVTRPSWNEQEETTSFPLPELAQKELRHEPLAAQPWDVFGVHDHFETVLSPVMICEETYQLTHDDAWMDFEIWNYLS